VSIHIIAPTFKYLRFNEVRNESHRDCGERKTDRADDLAVHRAINGRSGQHDSDGVECEVEHFMFPFSVHLSASASPRLT
jgi:hypothetical protein